MAEFNCAKTENTFHTLGKANSQSNTSTFEHLQLRKSLVIEYPGDREGTAKSEMKCCSWRLLNASQDPNYLDVPQQHWK